MKSICLVPMFKKLNKQLLDKMCQCLKPAFYTEHSFIVREGDLVDEMFFVWAGKLESVTSNRGRTSFFDTDILKPGDYCGEELLIWARDPCSSSDLPTSTRTVRVLHEVEAFTLTADDLKFVMSQFHSLHNKQQLRGTFRFYSQQWRSWAASNIQAAWRWYMKKKQHHVSQHGRQERLKEPLAEDSGSSSFSATIFASQISTNILRRRNYTGKVQLPRLPPMLLKKPAEPDFSPFGSQGIA